MCCAEGAHTEAGGEAGRVGVLFAVLLGIVAALGLVFANIAAVHLQHRRAMACADALALVGANVVDTPVYYCLECATGRDNIGVDGAQEAIREAFVSARGSTCSVGGGVHLGAIDVRGIDVQVEVRVQSQLPVVPSVIGDLVAPELKVTGKSKVFKKE